MSDAATNEWGADPSEPAAWVVIGDCGCRLGFVTNNPTHRDRVSQELAELAAAGYRIEPLVSLSDMNGVPFGHECSGRRSR